MIFVTGATGTVGSLVLRELLDRGAHVRAGIHRRPLGVPGVEARPIDYDRPETLAPALEGARAVFLLSDAIHHERTLVAAAREAGVEQIVKQSAFRAGEADFLVGHLHREVEREIERSGMAWTFLRPNFFMQNVVTVMGESIRNENAIYDSVGDARISHIDARDVARVAATVLTEPGHDGRVYELSGPEAIAHEELAETLTRTLGRPIRYVRIDDGELRRRFVAMGFSEEDAAAWVDINRSTREGADSLVTSCVRDLTGRAPTPFAAFCRDHAAALGAGQRTGPRAHV